MIQWWLNLLAINSTSSMLHRFTSSGHQKTASLQWREGKLEDVMITEDFPANFSQRPLLFFRGMRICIVVDPSRRVLVNTIHCKDTITEFAFYKTLMHLWHAINDYTLVIFSSCCRKNTKIVRLAEKILEHPPNNPNLAPSYFHEFYDEETMKLASWLDICIDYIGYYFEKK